MTGIADGVFPAEVLGAQKGENPNVDNWLVLYRFFKFVGDGQPIKFTADNSSGTGGKKLGLTLFEKGVELDSTFPKPSRYRKTRKRWRKAKERLIPSASSDLSPEQEAQRGYGKAYVPPASDRLVQAALLSPGKMMQLEPL